MNETVRGRIILECVVGSTLHGTNVQDGLEDLDLMAILIEDPLSFIGFNPVDTWVHRTKPEGVRSEAGDIDKAHYGLRKYLSLALRGNPTILLALFTPPEFHRVCTPEGKELQELASHIISRQVFQPFRRYMKEQHERLMGIRGSRNVTRPELVEKYGYDTKYAAHIIRLGIQGCELLKYGRLTLPMPEDERQIVRNTRNGYYTLNDIHQSLKNWEDRLEQEYNKSPLPLWPNRSYVQDWMINTYVKAFAGW